MPSQLLVTSLGWDHDGWIGNFYPQDLPKEWRLAYYANEFRAVVVPRRCWTTASTETVLRWCDDTPLEFRFFLEHPAGVVTEDFARFRPFGQRFGGIIVVPVGNMQPGSSESGKILIVNAPAGIEGGIGGTRGEETMTAVVWTDQQGQAPKEPLVVGRLDPAPTPRAVRSQITNFLSYAANGRYAVVVLDGQPPDIVTLRQAQQIGELLGY